MRPPRRTRHAGPAQVGPKPRIRALGYIRVSTEKQASEGISLDAQRIRLQAHCIAVDIDLVDTVNPWRCRPRQRACCLAGGAGSTVQRTLQMLRTRPSG